MIDFDMAALRRIGLTHAIAARLATHDRGTPARVAAVHRNALALHDGTREFPARPFKVFRRRATAWRSTDLIPPWMSAPERCPPC